MSIQLIQKYYAEVEKLIRYYCFLHIIQNLHLTNSHQKPGFWFGYLRSTL